MIPFLSDTPAPASALLSGPMPAHSAEGGEAALDFAGLLGAALAPETGAGAGAGTTALPAASSEAPPLTGAATPALAPPPLPPAAPGKGLPLPGADLPLPINGETALAPSSPTPTGAKPTRALLTRGGIAIAAPRTVVSVERLQEGARPGLGPALPALMDAEADTTVQIPALPTRAASALSGDLPIPAEATALATDVMPVAPLEPGAKAIEGDTAEADTPLSVPAPVPVAGAALVVAALPASVPGTVTASLAVAVPQPSSAVEVQARPLPLARNEAAPVRPANPSTPASAAPAEDAPAPALPSAATPIEALAEAPAQPAPAPAQSSPAPTLAAAPPMPVAAPERSEAVRASSPAVQLEQAIDQVGTLREAMRAARPEMTLRHAEFGFVSLRLEQAAPEQWRAVLASRDPGFVPAIQLALAERAVAATADSGASTGHHGGSQNGTGDQRYGASPNGGQGGSQPYLGQSGQRDGEAAPDHRRPSTAAALSARAEEEGEAAASPGHHARGTFA